MNKKIIVISLALVVGTLAIAEFAMGDADLK